MDEEKRRMDEENNSFDLKTENSITPVKPVSARNMLEALLSCFLTVARSSSLIHLSKPCRNYAVGCRRPASMIQKPTMIQKMKC